MPPPELDEVYAIVPYRDHGGGGVVNVSQLFAYLIDGEDDLDEAIVNASVDQVDDYEAAFRKCRALNAGREDWDDA